MKLGIMQPYLFPYLGYFQLINYVNKYLIYDDVNFIKQGWINRNRILVNKKEYLFTLELSGASSFKLINDINVGDNRNKLLKTIEQSYSKAPFFKPAFEMVQSVVLFTENNLGKFLTNSIRVVCEYLDVKTEILISSEIKKDTTLHGQDKILHICKMLGADEYVNAIGGQDLYSRTTFENNNIVLTFLKSKPVHYRQNSDAFIENLSIIDVVMNNSQEEIKGMLEHYEIH
jgi:hypothetical protein